jgi:ankyrin repeat protein
LRELLEDNQWLGSNSNVRKIAKLLKKSKGDERYHYFGLILDSTRYDLMKALVKRKILSEEELFNIALRCKLDELTMDRGSGSLQYIISKKALARLDKDLRTEFYSSLIDALVYNKANGLVEPQKENLEELYEELLISGYKEALAKLHDYLGYFKVSEDRSLFYNIRDARRNSAELVAAIEADDTTLAMKLISQGHYIYNLVSEALVGKIRKFIFLETLNHPNYNPFAVAYYDTTPMVLAAREGNVGVVEALLEMANGNIRLLAKFLRVDSKKRIIRPLEVAIEKGHEKVVAAILKAVDGNEWLLHKLFSNEELLSCAVRQYNNFSLDTCRKTKVLSMLLKAAGRDEKLLLALFHQRYSYNMFYSSDVIYTREAKHLKMFKLLIKNVGWSTQCLRKVLNIDGFETSLREAMRNRQVGVIKLLLKAVEGKSELLEELLLKPDYRGATILHWIVFSLSSRNSDFPNYPLHHDREKEMFLILIEAAHSAGILDKVLAAKNKGMKTVLDVCTSPSIRKILEIYQTQGLTSTAISQAIAKVEKAEVVVPSKVSRLNREPLYMELGKRRSSNGIEHV